MQQLKSGVYLGNSSNTWQTEKIILTLGRAYYYQWLLHAQLGNHSIAIDDFDTAFKNNYRSSDLYYWREIQKMNLIGMHFSYQSAKDKNGKP
jgi:hypothetical protein